MSEDDRIPDKYGFLRSESFIQHENLLKENARIEK